MKKNSILKKNKKLSIINYLREIKKEEKKKLNEVELRDKVEIPSISSKNIRKMIYNYLTKITDIKEIMNTEKFFKSKENKINFIFDGLRLPNIQNGFINNIVGNNLEWNNLNAINSKTLLNLNQLRFIIQKEKDKKRLLKEYNKRKTINEENKDIFWKHENAESQVEKLDQEYLYNCFKYFSSKILSYKNVNITKNLHIKNIIFKKYKYFIRKKNPK